MNKIEFDKTVEKFVSEINELCEGYSSISMAVAIGVEGVIDSLVTYQQIVYPTAVEQGLNPKTVSELFGVDIKITELDDDE